MTMQSFAAGMISLGGIIGTGSTNANTHVIDASGEKSGAIFQSPKTGDIVKIHFRTRTVTTGGTVDVRLETISSLFPSGTLFATNTNASQVINAADDNVWFSPTLTAAATVALGDYLAIVIVRDAAGNIQIATSDSTSQPSTTGAFPRGCLFTSSWAGTNTMPSFFLEYSDGTILPISPFHLLNQTSDGTYTSTSTPDERGNIFRVAFPCTVCGVQSYYLMDPGSTGEFVLYDSASNVIASVNVSGSEKSNSNTNSHHLFTTPVTLSAGVDYRLTLKATHATNIVAQYYSERRGHTVPVFGTTIQKTSRTDSGAWTEDSTREIRTYPIFSGFDDGASAGGMLVHPGMSGGMRG